MTLWTPNPKANSFIKPTGYTDLGWQIGFSHPIVRSCHLQNHKRREFDNSLYLFRCTDVITICDVCKYIYHTDMSD